MNSRCRPFSRQMLTLLAFGAFAAFSLHAAAPDEIGFKPLFNGRDLTGWVGDPAIWSVQDGVVSGRTSAAAPLKNNTFLIWQGGEVKDFELRVRVRFVAVDGRINGNSGIQYRSKVIDPAKWIVAGYQADMDAGGNYVGLCYEEKGRGILAKPGERVRVTAGDPRPKLEVLGATTPAPEIKASLSPDAWIDYTIIATGHRLRHFINGKLATEVVDDAPQSAALAGILALQAHVGPPMHIQFKDVRLKTLP